MQPKNTPPPPPGMQLKLSDIYEIFFKHKWLISVTTLIGVGFAIYYFIKTPAMYQSEAKLMVSYVKESKAPTGMDESPRNSGIQRVASDVMLSEAEILTSLDVATNVVQQVGVERFLRRANNTTNAELAAMNLKRGLVVEPQRRGNIMKLTYSSSDPTLVQPVLRAVIDTYFKRHVEIHRKFGPMDEFLTEKTAQLRNKLAATEDELRKAKQRANVSNFEESRRIKGDQIAQLERELLAAEVTLETDRTLLREMSKAQGISLGASTNEVAGSNVVVAATNTIDLGTNFISEVPKAINPKVLTEYRWMTNRVQAAWVRLAGHLNNFTPNSPTVLREKEIIRGLQAEQEAMEKAHPELLELARPVAQNAAPANNSILPPLRTVNVNAPIDLQSTFAQMRAQETRVQVLKGQLEKLKAEAMVMDEAEMTIARLQRQKEAENKLLENFNNNLEQQKQEMMFGEGKLSNISEIQSPSLSVKDSRVLKTRIITSLAIGLLSGIALAFFIELLVDQSIRKPSELETRFRLPVFLSVPKFGNGKSRKALTNGNRQAALPPTDPVNGDPQPLSNGALVTISSDDPPWAESHDLYPYSEALRDRLVTFFELKNMTHKPKLIALTSCSSGAGVTTLAAGLAASLSETGEGNVLLVDMNLDSGAAHPFYKGKPSCGLADVLEHDKRPAAMVHEKLYMVSGNEGDDRIPRILPKKFAHLLPKLQASDYDYIIFDLPPVKPTSVTPRLAGFMDMVFLVVEGEKTNREWIKQASNLLQQTKANVGAVYNKRRNYVPRWLQQEF